MKSLLTIFTTVLFCSTITAQCFRTTNDIKYYLNLKTYVTKDHSTKISFTSSSANLSGPGTYKSYYIGKCYIKNAYQAIIELHSNTTHEGLKLYLSCTDKMLTDASGSLLLYEKGTEPSGNTTTSTSRNNATTTKNTKSAYQIHLDKRLTIKDCENNYKKTSGTGVCREYYFEKVGIGSGSSYIKSETKGNGGIWKESYYKDGKRHGKARGWNGVGQLSREYNYINGKCDGLGRRWYPNGQLWMQENYINDKKDGLKRWWHENGQLKYERNFKDGKKDGLWREWDYNGQLKWEWNYKDGEKDGLWRTWWDNGQLKLEGNFKDGKEDGLWREWHYYGQLKLEENYKFDKYLLSKLISAKEWDKDGNLTKEYPSTTTGTEDPSTTTGTENNNSSTFKVGNLEVMKEDLGKMSWDDAIKTCAALGDGWRLPTKQELEILHVNKQKIGGFANSFYWSSTEYGNFNAWVQYFGDGGQISYNKGNADYVRAVRAF